jgi:uncharacterized membrane protein
MLPEPLHPMVIHLPLALAALMPLFAAAAIIAGWRDWLPSRRLWWAIVALQAMLAVGTVVAARTGENEEDRVEKVVDRAAVHRHEEAGEAFRNGAIATLVLTLVAALVPRAGLRRALAMVSLAATAVVLFLAYRTGKEGGELVYRHGAAAAYTTGAESPAPPAGDD